MKIRFLLYIAIIVLPACRPNRNLVYLNDLRGSAEYKTQIANNPPLQVQPDDLLRITINSLNPESSILFNNGVLAATSSANPSEATTVNNAVTSKRENEGYLVDREGFINFPVLGRVKLSGLTMEEATQKMTAEVRKYVKNPIVEVRLLNFKVTVIGEVNQPTSIDVPRERINVLEALGLAGDMTPFGRRENVLIIREKEGIRTATRLNLNSKDVLQSPYFYLQQNDVVYVEPDNQARLAQNDPNNRFLPIWAAVISTIGFAIISFVR
ncbi:polysaccharide biosynthesis/export family protein [Nibrella saemangeumensis]|uniref:Polysaccharide biosynthesis/export family protein n=1 Tax=Nibrella saemangeumensis TaxID=1084526 RepID=A0ABP8ML68_9BACT